MTDSTVLRLDGGLSTALERQGFVVDGPLWTGELLSSNPDAITTAHRGFVDAGADIIITGSYQLSFDGAERVGWAPEDVDRALRNSTTAARLAANEDTLVAASIGPYGAHLNDGSEFRGNYGVTTSVLREFHDRRLDVLLATDPDLLAVETIPDLDEAIIIMTLIEQKQPDIDFWVSFTVPEVGRISGGATFAEACAAVAEHEAATAVGINCSPLDVITPTLSSVDTDLPLVVYPNASQVWDSSAMAWVGEPRFATPAHLEEWIDLGARIIGGCCGYSATEVRTFRFPR